MLKDCLSASTCLSACQTGGSRDSLLPLNATCGVTCFQVFLFVTRFLVILIGLFVVPASKMSVFEIVTAVQR